MLSIRAALVSSVLFLAGGPAAEEKIAFRVPAETTLVRTLKNVFTLELQSMTVTMDGEEVPAEEMGEFDATIEREETFVVTDTFEVMGDGRPARLRRTFDELGGTESSHFTWEEGDEHDDSEYESALEGLSVVFTWNEESEAFDAAFGEGSEGDDELLEDLEEDMDLRRLLPDGAVEEGDSWEVDVDAFECIIDPGGDLALVDSEDEEEEDTDAREEQLRENVTGTLEATYKGTQVEDGVRLAVIAIAADTRTHSEEDMATDEMPEGGSGSGRFEVAFRLEGELRWDIENGHAHSLELSGENELTMIQTMSFEYEGESFEQSQTMVFAGDLSYTMRFERK